jgi:hypothetical protein
MYVNRRFLQLCTAFVLTIAVVGRSAMPAAADAMLVVTNTTDSGKPELRLTEAELKAFPQVTVRTRTEFTDGVVAFVGPLVRDVVAALDASDATTLHMVAANDYAVDIPMADVQDYDVILAMSANGKRLSIRDKGPIWVMYPLDDHPELQDSVYNVRLIWQLTRIEIK